MIQIIPAILATSEEQFRKDFYKIGNSNLFENGWVHIDFMDNKFVPNKSIGPDVVNKFQTGLKKEAHLMEEDPKKSVGKLKKAGFERVIVHVEAGDVGKSIESIKIEGMEVGLAIKNDTPLEKIKPFLENVETVLIMSVEPGFQGQPFLPEAIERVKEVARLRDENKLHFKIGIDGAISADNAAKIVEAGAEQLVIGSRLIQGDIDENLERIWEKIKG